jgi:transcription termination factor Rho
VRYSLHISTNNQEEILKDRKERKKVAELRTCISNDTMEIAHFRLERIQQTTGCSAFLLTTAPQHKY